MTLPLAAGMEGPKAAAAAMPYNLEDIHFDFDKYDLKPEALEFARILWQRFDEDAHHANDPK